MLPRIHSRVPSDSKLDALRAAQGDEVAFRCQVSLAEETRQAEQSMVAKRLDAVHDAAGTLGISEEASTINNTPASKSSGDALHVGVTQQQQGDPELVHDLGILTVNGDPRSERDEQSSNAMLIDIDTPVDLRNADVVDEERRQLARIDDQKRITNCPKSWKCLKCSVLNSHRSRSCDSCADKKPPPVLVARVKFPGLGRPRNENKSQGTSHPTVKKSHKKKVFICSPEEKLVGISKQQTRGPLPTPSVETEKISTTTTEVGLVIQPIKKSHKKKVVLIVPEVTAATIPSQVKGTVSTAIA
jgi:hypothetical protein